MATPIKVQIIIGSTRQSRFSEKIAPYIYEELKKEADVQAELIDLRDWPLPFFDEAASPNMNNGNYVNPLGRKWADKVNEADAYIIVTPEYNHGYPAVLKNALDWVSNREWGGKPVGFVAYGTLGGARAVGQLRQVAVELRMHPIRNSIHLPSDIFFKLFAAKPPVDMSEFKSMREGQSGDKVKIFFDELLGLARVLKSAR